jgi:hypothetical protein
VGDKPNEIDFDRIFAPRSEPYQVVELTSDQVLKWINSDGDDQEIEALVDGISDVNARLREEPGYVILKITP